MYLKFLLLFGWKSGNAGSEWPFSVGWSGYKILLLYYSSSARVSNQFLPHFRVPQLLFTPFSGLIVI